MIIVPVNIHLFPESANNFRKKYLSSCSFLKTDKDFQLYFQPAVENMQKMCYLTSEKIFPQTQSGVIPVKGISFIFPCLNESETIQQCMNELKEVLKLREDIPYEIIVADNGSTDESATIAAAAGARVISVKEKGYGAALKGGFAAARLDYLAFADADGSYPLDKLPAMFDAAIRDEADMVIASRMNGGKIEQGAMPFLHRYLGTPILTILINLLFHGKLTDCNSGFRLIKKSTYETWNLEANGMEFASELLITALKTNAGIVEIQGGLRKDLRSRHPHLQTWRDGMRHLLFILSEKPEIFDYTGFLGVLLTLFLSLVTLLSGPRIFGNIHIFDIHTKMFLIGFSVLFMQIYLIGCYLYTISDTRPSIWFTRKFLLWDEASIFFILLLLFIFEAIGVSAIAFIWFQNNFQNLEQSGLLFGLIQSFVLIGSFMIGLLTNALIRRYRKQNSRN